MKNLLLLEILKIKNALKMRKRNECEVKFASLRVSSNMDRSLTVYKFFK